MSRFDAGNSNSTTLPVAAEPYRIEVDPSNRQPKAVIFLPGSKEEQIFTCRRWPLLEPDFAFAFAEGFAKANIGNRPTTRIAGLHNLERGFFRWLRESKAGLTLHPADLDSAFFQEFDRWLDRKDDSGTRLIGISTALHRRSALAVVIEQMLGSRFSENLSKDFRLTRNPFAGRTRQTKPTPPLDLEIFTKFIRATETEVRTAILTMRRRKRLLENGRRILAMRAPRARTAPPTPGTEESSLGLLIATLEATFGSVLPSLEEIRRTSMDIYDQIQDWGAAMIYSVMHPSQYDLLPLAQQLALYTGFNESALVGLKDRAGIAEHSLLGMERLVIKSFKARANKYVSASFLISEEILGPASIVRAIRQWTKEIRAVAPSEIKDDFWLYVPKHNSRERTVRTLNFAPNTVTNHDLRNAQNRFSKTHGLPRIGFRQIRATVAAIAHDLFGGDVRAVMDFLQHSSSELTLRSYTSGVAAARYREIIGTVQVLRERWVQTNGRLDPRVLAEVGDPGAATPGWNCIDPYSSPIPGQRHGRLCDAYGFCPTCPHAKINLNSPVALARVRQVKTALERARGIVLPERWKSVMDPAYRAIVEFWLPFFSEAVVKQADLIHPSPIVPFD